MRHSLFPIIPVLLALSLLAGCGTAASAVSTPDPTAVPAETAAASVSAASTETPLAAETSKPAFSAEASSDATQESSPLWMDHLISTQLITQVYGDGQKPAAVVLGFDREIDSASVSAEDYTVPDYEITAAYTNTAPAMTETPENGPYVILELSTDYILPVYAMTIVYVTEDSNQLTVSVAQTGTIEDVTGSELTGSDVMLDTDYTENQNLIVDDFQQLIYSNPEDGSTLMYNLFVPEGADSGEEYPLVLFMPDATVVGTDPVKTLTQGLGAVVWADPENQAAHPCFVLAPQYTNAPTDNANTLALLQYIVSEYAVDENRLYTTGQSAGTIRSLTFMIENPDLFAGALLVAGQAENGYENMLNQLSSQNIWMVCSTGDAKALPGMTAIMEAVEAEGVAVTEGAWSCLLPTEEQNKQAEEMESAGTTVYFTVLSDVVPEGVKENNASQHLNTWRVAYSIPALRDWLFRQSK